MECVFYVFESHQRCREAVENDAPAEAAACKDLVARIELAAIHTRSENLHLITSSTYYLHCIQKTKAIRRFLRHYASCAKSDLTR